MIKLKNQSFFGEFQASVNQMGNIFWKKSNDFIQFFPVLNFRYDQRGMKDEKIYISALFSSVSEI